MTIALTRDSSRPALSVIFAGAALVAMTALGGSPTALEAQSLRNHDSNAPVDFSADRIELQDREDRVVFSGNVDVSQAGLELRASRMTVAYTNGTGLEIDRIDASGGVTVTKGGEQARGNVGIYDFNRRIITLIGNVSLRQGSNVLDGGRLVIDLKSGRSTVDGRTSGSSTDPSTGRVSGRFSVPKRGQDQP